MSYQGGNHGYWPGPGQSVPYNSQNPHPQALPHGVPAGAYYPTGQAPMNQPQVAQQWSQNTQHYHQPYGQPNGYAVNQSYSPMSLQRHPQTHPQSQPQYTSPQPALQQIYPQQHTMPHINTPIPHSYTQAQSNYGSHAMYQGQRQPSAGIQRPASSSPSNNISQLPPQPAVKQKAPKPAQARQNTKPPTNSTNPPTNNTSRAPQPTIIRHSELMSPPQAPERTTISPSDLSRPPQTITSINPAELLSNSPGTENTINPAGLLSRTPDRTTTISPANLMSVPTERTISPSNMLRPPSTTPAHRSPSQGDPSMLILSLAEEYFDAAHAMATSVALLADEKSFEQYHKLIATGLGCLETAMKRLKLSPRDEANVILRFAGILYQEDTDNFMDAELALTKGIAISERNHYFDLKYAMQFLLAQFMFKKSPKAAMKALDGNIADAQTYRHYSWVYAFRFLRASRAMELGNLADSQSGLQNLRAISSVSSEQGDRAIFLMSSLMEAMAYLHSANSDAIEQVQRAIAAAWTYQLDEDNQIPQLTGLTHILDVACSLRHGNVKQMLVKLKAMQVMMDEAKKNTTWSYTSDVLAIPISRKQTDSHVVSKDTRAVLGIGKDGRDNLMVTFLNMRDAQFIRQHPADRHGLNVLTETLKSLSVATYQPGKGGNLPDLLHKARWRTELLCYFHIYTAFCDASVTDWRSVKKCIDDLKATISTIEAHSDDPLAYFAKYIEGVFHQGSGHLEEALTIFQSPMFDLSRPPKAHPSTSDQTKRDVSILAALNSVWIQQGPGRQDRRRNTDLLERLGPLCQKHRNRDIRTAYNLLVVTVETEPPQTLIRTKEFLQQALGGAKSTGNELLLCITLNLTCYRFFNNVVGDQAIKSALVAENMADKSGNVLWMSVANGMLAQKYSLQGKHAEAQVKMEEAMRMNQAAFPEL
ncbi:hypothetical protein BP5796_08582 [Coleophoma crateriformis]|uniref:Uncharacterized protein n=1 Tax=Coleophoma crateriformis TaxID=565419 RepID=A0A3D8R816_9HELO|nr:hypothetical protein BP5796_08582 [Coleophoma crateriformis]